MVVTLLFGALNSLGYTEWDYDNIIYPAGGASVLCLILVSLPTPPSEEAKWRPFMTKWRSGEGADLKIRQARQA